MNEITLGDVTITRIEEMHGPIMPPENFFPDIPAAEWAANADILVPDHYNPAENMVQVAMQTWLVRSEGRTILIDTGVGNDKARPAVPSWDHLQLDYLGNLARAGVQPSDVDLVVNTHLHVDHVGWNTTWRDGQWVPTFPNATYLMPELDFKFWNPANNPNLSGGVNENVFEDSVAPVHVAGQVQLWDGEYQIDAGLRLQAAPGHTPGSSVVTLTSGAEHALFAGDLIHTPLQLRKTGHNSCFCEDPATAVRTREQLLGWAADHHALVLPAHLSGHSGARIHRHGDSYDLDTWAPFDRY